MSNKIIIGLMGEARVGKDSIADMLVAEKGFKKVSFADPLKKGCMEIFGFTHDQVYGNLKEVVDPYWNFTPRYALQYVGTDLFRKWKSDIWVHAMEKRIVSSDHDKWIIPDCRFINEMDQINKMGGEVWRIFRTDGPGASKGIASHPSEEEMKTIPLDSFSVILERPTGVERLLEDAREKYKERFEQ